MILTAEQAYRGALAALRRGKLFYGHGTHSAAEEAALLVAHVLGIAPGNLHDERRRPVSAIQRRRLDRLVNQRIAQRLPAPYLTHEAWLGDLSFYVDRRVLIPRSHIAELLREAALPGLRSAPRRVLDLCTGSGCLAVVAAHAFPRTRVDATDISARALAVAKRNVKQHGLSGRIRLLRSDLFASLEGARYDLILSNPPYVTGKSMRVLPPEYLHEPRLALAGGPDGLELVRRILHDAGGHLTARGVLMCEVGSNRRALERAFPRLPFLWLESGTGEISVFTIERSQLP